MIKKKCRICSNKKLIELIDYKRVRLSGNFFKKNKALKDKSYALKLIICDYCKHLQINNNLSPAILFKHYVWKTSDSKTNLSLIKEFYDELIKKNIAMKESKIMEIASNDGSLLKEFCKKNNNLCLGVEPAKNLKKYYPKYIKLINNFFSYKLSNLIKKKYNKFDIIIARNVVAHLNNPNDVFKGVENIINNDGIFVVEVPYVYFFFKENQYDNVFHEHNGFHSIKSLKDLSEKNKLFLFDVSIIKSQGGSIRCYISKNKIKQSDKLKRYLKIEKEIRLFNISTWKKYANRVYAHKYQMINLIKKLNNKGKSVSVYGASGKGQVFLQFTTLNHLLIKKAYDKNKDKIGKVTPGTFIKIYDPINIKKDMPDYLLLTSWNIKDEIIKQETEYLKKGGKLILPFPNPKIINL